MTSAALCVNENVSKEKPRYSLRSAAATESAGTTTTAAPALDADKCINGQRRSKSSSTTTAMMTAMMHRSAGSHPHSHGSAAAGSSVPLSRRSKSESDSEIPDLPGAREIILQYSVDPYDYSHNELIALSIEIFRHFDLLHCFNFSETALRNFFLAVKDLYRTNNDFHNFRHAWGVMHMVFQILLHGAEEYLDDFDLLAVLVAAICHDVGHPGNNNAFELAINSDVSKKYALPDEVCVLEKYHASETQSLLSKRTRRHSNLLASLSEEDKQRFFNQVRFIILGTDMAKHSALVMEAKELVETIVETTQHKEKEAAKNKKEEDQDPAEEEKGHEEEKEENSCKNGRKRGRKTNENESSSERSASRRRRGDALPPLIPGSPMSDSSAFSSATQERSTPREKRIPHRLLDHELRLALTRIVVHTADIGAQTQQLDIACKWAERLYREFRSQAEKERALGIVTSPFLHQLQDDYLIYTSQASFISDIVQPIWNGMHRLLPRIDFAVSQLSVNKSHYEVLGASMKAKKEKNASAGRASKSENLTTESTAIVNENKESQQKNRE